MIAVVDAVARILGGESLEVDVELPAGVVVRRSRLIPAAGGFLSGMGRPAAAVALGRTILVHPDVAPSARLLRHEAAHVAQWMREPLVFPFRYILAHIRHGYDRNPFEMEARAAEAAAGPTGEAE